MYPLEKLSEILLSTQVNHATFQSDCLLHGWKFQEEPKDDGRSEDDNETQSSDENGPAGGFGIEIFHFGHIVPERPQRVSHEHKRDQEREQDDQKGVESDITIPMHGVGCGNGAGLVLWSPFVGSYVRENGRKHS